MFKLYSDGCSGQPDTACAVAEQQLPGLFRQLAELYGHFNSWFHIQLDRAKQLHVVPAESNDQSCVYAGHGHLLCNRHPQWLPVCRIYDLCGS